MRSQNMKSLHDDIPGFWQIWFDLTVLFLVFNATFIYIMATSFSGGRSRREPTTMGKQPVNIITCGYESSALFFVIYTAGREPTSYWW
jgi:hypothetical protein